MRLAELALALSLATDLGTGQPMEHALAVCWVSLRVAEDLGVRESERSTVFYSALLRFLGCTSDASDTAAMVGGDEVAFNAVMAPMLGARGGEDARHFFRHVGEGQSLPRRARLIAGGLRDPGAKARSLSGHCEVASRLAERMGLGTEVIDALAHAYERWDGKGFPDRLACDAIPLPIRIVSAVRDSQLWNRAEGWPAAARVLADRRGRSHDPTIVDLLSQNGEEWFAALDQLHDLFTTVLDDEPGPHVAVHGDGLVQALGAVGDFVDLKSPFFRGHSPAVADLAAAAGAAAGFGPSDIESLRYAGLMHDIGQVGIPAGIWDRRGPLSVPERERVELHTLLGERVLARCSGLAAPAAMVGCHHERADGSGYHRGTRGDDLAVAARLLAVADCYQALTEDRPHRPARTTADAVAVLLDEADQGRFRRADVDAVLDAAGQRGPRRPVAVARPAGLTEREVDVLRLVARGRSNKAAAAELGISAKTVGHHLENIYAKADVRTRAGATLFAMENDLLGPPP